jgi:hypothetical protein
MTHQEIKELAGHRAVSPWVMKLVGDAVAKERELLNTVFWAFQEWKEDHMSDGIYIQTVEAIRARGQA